ncbi:MAG: hypothetical protein CSA75_02925, partial [Sorangium cellulosum]
ADYAASCIPSGTEGLRDAVAAITIPDDQAYDLDVLVRGQNGLAYTATAAQCGDPSTELACGDATVGPNGPVSRFIARSVPAGTLPIYLATDIEQDLSIRALLRPTQPAPTNETCGTALDLTPGEPVDAVIVGVEKDLLSECETDLGELVYRFEIDTVRDVYVFGGSLDGLGEPSLSLRNERCSKAEHEIACKQGAVPLLFERALPAGLYYVSVSTTAPTTVQLRLELEDPSEAPEDETCEDAPSLTPGLTENVSLREHVDDLDSCLTNAVDAVRALDLSEPSDVLLLGNLSTGDEGAVSLWNQACEPDDMLACGTSSRSPVRISKHDVAPGHYRSVIETRQGNPTRLTAFTRPAVAPTYVVFADTCEEAQLIGPMGGFFQGNTSNSSAQYGAGCDQAGGLPSGAPEQMLRLDLSEKRRVIFDMRGSTYRTLLNVRRGPSCPGTEIVSSCAVGFYPQRSFLDLTLDAGTYFVQVDGFFGESGPWYLDVYVAAP